MAERIVGIDFGTSTSVIRVKRYRTKTMPLGDRIGKQSVLFDGNHETTPTLVLRKQGYS